MEKEQPPDPGNRDFDNSSTDDKIQAYEAVANAYQAGTQPAIFLTHSFLQDNPILLEEGCLSVNWDWIPRLYSQTDQMLMVSITDAQWDQWGWPRGWTVWEPDTQLEHFRPNLAVVLCKGMFDDATDPEQLEFLLKVGKSQYGRCHAAHFELLKCLQHLWEQSDGLGFHRAGFSL